MKSFTAFFAAATALCLSQVALADGPTPSGVTSAQQDLRSPDRIMSPDSRQDLRSPDRTMSAVPRQDLRGPDRHMVARQLAPESVVVVPDPTVASARVSSGGGLSAPWIVLISLGGALALAGVTYTAMRAVHRHGPAAS